MACHSSKIWRSDPLSKNKQKSYNQSQESSTETAKKIIPKLDSQGPFPQGCLHGQQVHNSQKTHQKIIMEDQ